MKTLLTIVKHNGSTIMTRQQARNIVNLFKSKGVSASVIDNKQSDQRWAVNINSNTSKTLQAPRKPKGNTFVVMKTIVAHNALQWLKDVPSKNIPVYMK